MTKTNHHKLPQITANLRKPPEKTQNHHTSPQTTTNHHQNLGIGSETRDDAGKPPQTTANHCKPPPEFGMMVIRVLVKSNYFVFKAMAHSKWPSRVGGARCFCEYRSFQILHIYDVSVVVCGDFEVACLVGKPPQITTEMP